MKKNKLPQIMGGHSMTPTCHISMPEYFRIRYRGYYWLFLISHHGYGGVELRRECDDLDALYLMSKRRYRKLLTRCCTIATKLKMF